MNQQNMNMAMDIMMEDMMDVDVPPPTPTKTTLDHCPQTPLKPTISNLINTVPSMTPTPATKFPTDTSSILANPFTSNIKVTISDPENEDESESDDDDKENKPDISSDHLPKLKGRDSWATPYFFRALKKQIIQLDKETNSSRILVWRPGTREKLSIPVLSLKDHFGTTVLLEDAHVWQTLSSNGFIEVPVFLVAKAMDPDLKFLAVGFDPKFYYSASFNIVPYSQHPYKLQYKKWVQIRGQDSEEVPPTRSGPFLLPRKPGAHWTQNGIQFGQFRLTCNIKKYTSNTAVVKAEVDAEDEDNAAGSDAENDNDVPDTNKPKEEEKEEAKNEETEKEKENDMDTKATAGEVCVPPSTPAKKLPPRTFLVKPYICYVPEIVIAKYAHSKSNKKLETHVLQFSETRFIPVPVKKVTAEFRKLKELVDEVEK